jgi:hypothetical protein
MDEPSILLLAVWVVLHAGARPMVQSIARANPQPLAAPNREFLPDLQFFWLWLNVRIEPQQICGVVLLLDLY